MTKKMVGSDNNRNILNQKQNMLLSCAMVRMEKELQQEQPTLIALAQRMTRELGFKVTSSNIKYQLETGVVQGYSPPITIHPTMNSIESLLVEEVKGKMNAMEQRISYLEERLRKAEKELMNLIMDLNSPAQV